jgi:autotransporter-associated beta strand protein
MLILSGSNDYNGKTCVDAGTLVVTNNAALPDGSSLVVGAGGESLFGLGASEPAAQAVPEPGAPALLLAAVGIAVLYRRLAFCAKWP